MQHYDDPHPYKPPPERLFQEERRKFNKPVGLVNLAILLFIGLVIIVGIILVYFHLI